MLLTSSLPGIVLSRDWHFNKTVVLHYRFHTGGARPRAWNHQRPTGSCASAGLRGSRRWSVEPRTGSRNPSRQRCPQTGLSFGNWLTADEASALWQLPDDQTLTGKRNRAILATLLGCGLRRRELAELASESLQRREERWAIVDSVGKGRHIRTVPVPNWVKETLDVWLTAAGIESGPLFRCVCRAGKLWGTASQTRRLARGQERRPQL
jgi:site-specific recombinase XerC